MKKNLIAESVTRNFGAFISLLNDKRNDIQTCLAISV